VDVRDPFAITIAHEWHIFRPAGLRQSLHILVQGLLPWALATYGLTIIQRCLDIGTDQLEDVIEKMEQSRGRTLLLGCTKYLKSM
jgi:hypothetical protein